MNKKAVAKIIVDIWAYILFFLIITFFLLIIMFSKKTADLQLEDFRENTDSEYILMTYLRSPVPGMNMDFSELILFGCIDKTNYANIYNQKEKEFMKNIPLTDYTYLITINCGDGLVYDLAILMKKITVKGFNFITLKQELPEANMLIPSEKNIWITLSLAKK